MRERCDANPKGRASWAGACLWAAAVGLVSLVVFGTNLASEPHFVDESAYLSQSYFADLLLRGDRNNLAWLSYPAVDLPPFPKYLIGVALRAGGYPRPGPEAARTWYTNTSFRVGTPEMLTAARWPSVIMGALGCVALYGIGSSAGGRRMGAVAAVFLMFNPLYRMHARRAMADVPTEAFILATAAVALWGWQRALRGGRGAWLMPILSGAGAGVLGCLAVSCKLNGGLGLMIVAAWVMLAAALPRVPIGRKLAVVVSAMIAGLLSYPTFVALNPYLTAHPSPPLPAQFAEVARMDIRQRTQEVLRHRVRVSAGQKVLFPHNALYTPRDKVEVVIVQGFGRFGLLGPKRDDSTRRFDWSQDAGAVVWLPLVIAGAVWAIVRGRAQLLSGAPPTAWAILVQALVALMAVTAYIPLAWDRYYLSLQPGSALLAAGALVSASDWLTVLFRGRREA